MLASLLELYLWNALILLMSSTLADEPHDESHAIPIHTVMRDKILFIIVRNVYLIIIIFLGDVFLDRRFCVGSRGFC